VRAFASEGHLCTILSRDPRAAASDSPTVRNVVWDARTVGPWIEAIEGADVVINLAGRSVNCRYTRAHLDVMMRSRVDSTRVVGEAIARARNPPRLWLQSATATVYAHRYDAPTTKLPG